jgi:hypothetical protein
MVLLRLQACRCLASCQRQIGDKAVKDKPKTKLSRTNRRQSCQGQTEDKAVKDKPKTKLSRINEDKAVKYQTKQILYIFLERLCANSAKYETSKNTYLVSINASILRTPVKSFNHPYQSTNPHEMGCSSSKEDPYLPPPRAHRSNRRHSREAAAILRSRSTRKPSEDTRMYRYRTDAEERRAVSRARRNGRNIID